MELIAVPMWGQFGILGLSIGLNIFFITQMFRGEIPTRKQLDQVQKLADTFQKAYETEANRADLLTQTINKLVVVGDTMERILDVLAARAYSPPERRDDDDVASK